MSNYQNPYRLEIEENDGRKCFYITFLDVNGICHRVKVSYKVYKAFLAFQRQDQNQQRWDERHKDYREFENSLRELLNPPKGVEESYIDNEKYLIIQSAINTLTDIQKRRFILYYNCNFSYSAIAKIEKRHLDTIRESVISAANKIRKAVRQYENGKI